tara:strand:- start:207 stop:644 length:438 start_codon:yes stop_codon:yes gene_type:complete
MKKLLALLLLSPLAFADIVNLTCEYYKTVDMETLKTTELPETKSFNIESLTKRVVTEDGSFSYTEKGNQITWQAFGGDLQLGGIYAFANIYTLDRVSGEMKNEFRDIKNPKGFDYQQLFRLKNYANSYELRTIHNAKCKRKEALF